ncbi:MAG: bifunctional aspartate kinase/homoserine dehydrogenase I [Pseudomonadota bacterium]
MTDQNRWTTYKFGGSSLADYDCFRQVATLVRAAAETTPCCVVVSAMGGMTDGLLELITLAEAEGSVADRLDALERRYLQTAACLLDPPARAQVIDAWTADRRNIEDLLSAIQLLGSAPQRTRDVIAGFGELWSARLLSALLNSLSAQDAVQLLDAREVITVRQTRLGASVLWDESRRKLGKFLAGKDPHILVVTGFVASDEAGLQTTLGRNGSDHSAAIMGALLGAQAITIWTDVPGVMSGDPRKVPNATVISRMSYSEAMELAYFGAKVIHPQTMGPAIEQAIPIYIRSTFAPDTGGTCVSHHSGEAEPIKGITSIGAMAVVNVEGAGMIGVPGTAHRIFEALRAAEISVTLISQASSEHSVCFVVPDALGLRAQAVIRAAFATEIEEGQIQSVALTRDCSVVAVVGDSMSGTPGVAGRFLSALGNAGINAIAIAQGSSERNISVVVPGADATRAVRAVHSGFYLSAKTLSIGIVGVGTVGSALLKQLQDQRELLKRRFNLDLRVRAIARSRSMLLDERHADEPSWRRRLDDEGVPTDLNTLADHVAPDHLPHAVLVDCTASEPVVDRYTDWARRGIHIVTPNKRAFSGPSERLKALRSSAQGTGAHLLYETTVGAALPVLGTLKDLRDTGDRVSEVQGIFSGTLAYLFNQYDGSVAFSEIVRQAREAGFTEPDPRDDLSGMDVARKMVIVARELGFEIELDDVTVESLVPEGMEALSVDAFLAELEHADPVMAQRVADASAQRSYLRYIATLNSEGQVSVALRTVPHDDTFARLALTDNMIRIRSDRYATNPLVIQGPGAGPEVTAAGIFADLLRLADRLRGPV